MCLIIIYVVTHFLIEYSKLEFNVRFITVDGQGGGWEGGVGDYGLIPKVFIGIPIVEVSYI